MRWCFAVVLAGIALGGCDPNLGVSGDELNMGKVRSVIARETRRHAGVAAGVHCPYHIVLEKGKEFDCIAKFAIGRVRVRVVLKDKEGHVKYYFPKYKILDMPKVAYDLEQRLKAKYHQSFIAVCPQPVLQRKAHNFSCSASSKEGLAFKVKITQRDSNALLAFRLKHNS